MSKLQNAKNAAKGERAKALQLALASAAVGAVLNAGADSAVLERLPTGFATEALGKGQPVYKNRRVQLLAAATAGLVLWGGKSLSTRIATVAIANLLGSAIRNHKSQYLDQANLGIREVYK